MNYLAKCLTKYLNLLENPNAFWARRLSVLCGNCLILTLETIPRGRPLLQPQTSRSNIMNQSNRFVFSDSSHFPIAVMFLISSPSRIRNLYHIDYKQRKIWMILSVATDIGHLHFRTHSNQPRRRDWRTSANDCIFLHLAHPWCAFR